MSGNLFYQRNDSDSDSLLPEQEPTFKSNSMKSDSDNWYEVKPEPGKSEPCKSEGEEKEDQQTSSFFGTLFSNDLLPKEKALSSLPYFLFLAFLGLIYIANRHNAESKIRQITLWTAEIQELKWELIGDKAKWMLATKQSQIRGSAGLLGLKQSTTPPFIIRVKE